MKRMLSVVSIAFIVSIFQVSAIMAEELVLMNGTLIDGTGDNPIINATIVVRDNHILAVGPYDAVSIPENARIIDVKGATMLPGFINAHVHDGYNEQNLQAWAQAGVTTVRDLAWVPGHSASFELRDALNENPQNARLVAVGPVVTTVGGYPGFGLEVTSPDDARQKVNTLIDEGADLIKISIEDDLPKSQRWPMLSPEEIGVIVETAHARGLPVTAHISRARHLKIAIEAGVDDVAHMIVDPLPDDLVTRMIAQDMYWEPTLELWDGVHRQYGADWNAVAIDNLGHFAAAGGKVVLGTDFGTGYIFDFELGMPMTEIALMQKAGMTPMQIIMAATKHAAQVCNLGPQLGTLEPGKIADIIVVAGDPLDDMAAMQNVRIVVHNGILIRNDIK